MALTTYWRPALGVLKFLKNLSVGTESSSLVSNIKNKSILLPTTICFKLNKYLGYLKLILQVTKLSFVIVHILHQWLDFVRMKRECFRHFTYLYWVNLHLEVAWTSRNSFTEQAPYLKFKWLQLYSNLQTLSSQTKTLNHLAKLLEFVYRF